MIGKIEEHQVLLAALERQGLQGIADRPSGGLRTDERVAYQFTATHGVQHLCHRLRMFFSMPQGARMKYSRGGIDTYHQGVTPWRGDRGRRDCFSHKDWALLSASG